MLAKVLVQNKEPKRKKRKIHWQESYEKITQAIVIYHLSISLTLLIAKPVDIT